MKHISQHQHQHRWQEGAVIYQIYPRSFQDTNSDGVGDLRGVINRLDYLKELGVTGLWLTPFYPSPMVDFGYDISDYCAVDPLFGSLDDFKELVAAAHERDIRVLVDLVANHTSDQHPWFKESRSSRNNPKASWYIWKNAHIDPRSGEQSPPNNWREALKGSSAWEWDDTRGQYYLHSWHKRQPDLNWTNKEVRRAIKDVMRFWLDLGVDGFRADAVDWIAKDPLFRDDRPNPDYVEDEDSPYDALLHDKSRGWPTEYVYLAEMTSVFEEEPYRTRAPFLIAETYQERHNPADAYVAFYGGLDPELAAPFNFEGLYLEWEALPWRRFLHSFYAGLAGVSKHCTPCYAFGNHDNPRLVTRLGTERARSAALLQMTLPGMAVVYYGEELGMHNVAIPKELQHDAHIRSRDPERTPMQWSAGKKAGFSDAAHTWLPLPTDYLDCNAATELHDPNSYYRYYRTLLALRREHPALCHGEFKILDVHEQDVLCFTRTADDETIVVFVNFADHPVSCVADIPLRQLLLSSKLETKLAQFEGAEGHIELLPNEAALFLQ